MGVTAHGGAAAAATATPGIGGVAAPLDGTALRKGEGAGSGAFRRMTGLLVGGALLGKVLGMAREVLMARMLGASLVADSFRGGLTAIMLPLALLQNDSVPAVMIPLHRTWRAEGDAPRRFAALTVGVVLLAAVLMLLVEVLADSWVHLVVGGFSPEAQAATVSFVRVMALAMPASAGVNCLAAVEISLGRSRVTLLRASVQNVAVMAGIAAAAVLHQPVAIAWAFAASFNGLALWGGWKLWREGELDLHRVTPPLVARAAGAFLRGLRPLLAQPLADGGMAWLERRLASGVGVGTVASLDYARTITESALFVVSTPVGLAVLSGDPVEDAGRRAEAIARPVLALAMPASVFLALFAPDLVRLLLARGAFDEAAVALTSQALCGIATGLWAATLGWILVRLLNGAGRNARAAWILVAAFAANAVFSLVAVPLIGIAGLGGGEALRGVVLLAGTALALGCLRRLAWVALLALPACAALALSGTLVLQHVGTPLGRLLLGLGLCAVAGFASLLVLAPGLVRAVAARAGIPALTVRFSRR